VLKLLKASRTPNPPACVEDIHYLDGRNLNRDLIERLAACRWIDRTANLVILGKSFVGKSYLAQALVNAACRRDYTARYFRLDDLANQLAVYQRHDSQRLAFLTGVHTCEVLVLDEFLTTPIAGETAAELLNILAAREGRGSTVATSQFDPEDWYRSLHDAVIAESILNRISAAGTATARNTVDQGVSRVTVTSVRQNAADSAIHTRSWPLLGCVVSQTLPAPNALAAGAFWTMSSAPIAE
jgi:DNA replication protein DnaC